MKLESEVRERIELSTRVAAGFAHSLAGPLQSAMNALFVLRRRLENDGQLQLLAEVETQLQELRQQLEGYGRLSSARLQLKPVSLSELVRLAFGRIPDRDRVQTEIGEDREVEVDAGRLVLAMHHLIRNALENSAKSDPVRLGIRCLEGRLRIEVCDAGDRPWPDPPERALDPLFTTKPGPVGLGLSLACAAVERSGGTLSIEQTASGHRVALEVPLAP